METKKTFNRVNIESLFATLYATGSAKLSDHFYDDDKEQNESGK